MYDIVHLLDFKYEYVSSKERSLKTGINPDQHMVWFLGPQSNMEDLSFFVGVIGNIISILMFLSPVHSFWRKIKQGSTQDFSSLPYICALLNSSLWTYYGLIKPGEYLVATVNGFGVVVETLYVILFLTYAPKQTRAKTAILAVTLDVGILVAAMLAIQLALKGETRIDAVGIMGAGLNIVMYGSPLAAMKTMVTTRSVEYMPFFLSFSFFLNGGVWLLFAILVRDYIILRVPNGTGFLLGAMQLVLYGIYKDGKSSKSITNRLEVGSVNEHLISSSVQSHEG